MSNQTQSSNKNKMFDLVERTGRFGEDVIIFVKQVKISVINESIIRQLIRSGTSIGANYMEADGAESKKDFMHKIGICKKEAKETMHWLRMLAKAESTHSDSCRVLWKEAHEFALIFSSIVRKK